MPNTLILLRHGESTWNAENRFTGWEDPPLSDRGRDEASAAAGLLSAAGLEPTVVHTSLLLRAIQTANITLEGMGRAWLPVRRSWRLNERHYGALQGLNKSETAAKFGEAQVKIWRRSYDIPPPPLERDAPNHPSRDVRYRGLPDDDLPACECLRDVVARVMPYWESAIVPDLRAGEVTLVAAHGNSLRALVKHLDGVSDQDIVELNLPTGVPRVYELNRDMTVARWTYLGDPAEIAARTAEVARQGAAPR
ncbi:MAG: 2,3-diphosphoglycerate-dependent phosphoglycerate mutase [Candidatus Dormibacteria bacterium]